MDAAVIDLGELAHTKHSREFVGAEHGGVPFSVILVDAAPGAGPDLHEHPYAELFIVSSGKATFRLGTEAIDVPSGRLVLAPPNVPHGFINSGSDRLVLTAIHAAPEFITTWLKTVDAEWVP